MQHLALIASLAGMATLTGAQITFNETTGEIQCPPSGGNYCAGDSLQTNIIVRCTGTRGQPGNCNDNLAGIPPVGVKNFAPCYQSSPTAGDAACSFNGIAYPDSGAPFPVSNSSSNGTTSSMTASTSATVTISPSGSGIPPPYPSSGASGGGAGAGAGYNATATAPGAGGGPTASPTAPTEPFTPGSGSAGMAATSVFLITGLAAVMGLMAFL